jgi:prephenate dehydratase
VPLVRLWSRNHTRVGEGIEADTQALGQSSTFLNTHLPNAKRIAVASTALAAESLIAPISFGERAAGGGAKAAICSKSVVEIYDELEVLYEGTQDRSGMSRFLLLSLSQLSRMVQVT